MFKNRSFLYIEGLMSLHGKVKQTVIHILSELILTVNWRS